MMTVYYDSDKNAIVENNPDYATDGDNGELELHVEEMPPHKLGNLQSAVEDAVEANDDE